MMDLEATNNRFEDTGRNKSKWARAWGFDPERVRSVLRGRFPPKAEEVEALQKDGLYVEKKAA